MIHLLWIRSGIKSHGRSAPWPENLISYRGKAHLADSLHHANCGLNDIGISGLNTRSYTLRCKRSRGRPVRNLRYNPADA